MAASASPRPLPPLVMVAGSAFLIFHFLVLTCLALAAPNGPWPTAMGPSPGLGPPFATSINDWAAPHYLQPLYLAHNYHFVSNIPEMPSVRFEVKLKDQQGNEKTISIPDPKANFWVRHRQKLLAQALGNDQQVPVNQGQVVAPSGKKLATFKIWKETDKGRPNQLVEVNEAALTGSTNPVMRPSDWALLAAQSYVRYLCRVHGADRAELVRVHRDSFGPEVLYSIGEVPASLFEDRTFTFGELRK